MSRRTGAAAAVAAALFSLASAPPPVAAHAIGGTFQLPVPLWLYLTGAAAAVAASFAVIAFVAGRRPVRPAAGVAVPARVSAVARTVLRLAGVVLWYGAMAVGVLVGGISPLPAVTLWVVVWISLPIVAAALGNPWPSMSPFRTTFGALERLADREGALDLGLRYPRRLARWPAVVLLGAAIWAELILPGGEVAGTVAAVMAVYTLLTLLGMLAFGPAAWLRNAEIFEVLLGWYGRIGPVGRRSLDPALCAPCPDACEPATCVDCPGCATRADDTQRRAELRPWFAGLATLRGTLGWSDAAFVVLLLAGITYDGLRETAFGGMLLTAILAPINAEFGLTPATFLLVDTAFLAVLYVAFLAAFVAVVAVTRRLEGARHADRGATAGAYAATLLPIAAGYLVAHYFTLVIQAATWLPSLLVDPLMSLAPEVGWMPIGLVWYLSVGAIVGGHVAGVALAHRLSLDRAGRSALVVGLPMVLLMVSYTVLSLWIIAQPIVVDPVVG